MNVDIFALVSQAIQQALAGKESLFQGIGISLWGSFATLIILFFGAEWMFAPESINGSRVFRLVLQLAICKTLLMFYVTPIPGLGNSFTGLIVNEASYLSQTIGQVNYDQIPTATADLLGHMPEPSFGDLKGVIEFSIVNGLTGLVAALAFAIGSFGFIVQAILILFGPLFIPFYIVPQLDFLAWNWFKAFLQYSFYSVMGAAYTYIYTFIITALYQQLAQYMQGTGANVGTAIGGLIWLVIIGLFGAFLIPSLVSHLFGGSSGSSPTGALAGFAVSKVA